MRVAAMRVVVADGDDAARADLLAARLDLLRATAADPARHDLALAWRRDRLEARFVAGAFGPVAVDFGAVRARDRRRTGGRRSERIARAAGLHRAKAPVTLVDATAGLGRDAFVLASLGAQVIALERSVVVAALLEDGLRRAAADPATGEVVPARFTLVHADACEWLTALAPEARPDVVCLDPMFPPRKKAAQVKKEMQLFQRLLGPEEDTAALWASACAAARRRVVVKRPVHAPPLAPDPSVVYEGRTTRFDVYLTEESEV